MGLDASSVWLSFDQARVTALRRGKMCSTLPSGEASCGPAEVLHAIHSPEGDHSGTLRQVTFGISIGAWLDPTRSVARGPVPPAPRKNARAMPFGAQAGTHPSVILMGEPPAVGETYTEGKGWFGSRRITL